MRQAVLKAAIEWGGHTEPRPTTAEVSSWPSASSSGCTDDDDVSRRAWRALSQRTSGTTRKTSRLRTQSSCGAGAVGPTIGLARSGTDSTVTSAERRTGSCTTTLPTIGWCER